ncbi:DUF4232 domain-containing protein [Streptomyces sp. NPDC018031]|uniref:DUF4232 domain-containing protein n=1 Tax=Streptomyces sp. NPDC018031 TaxID=3365033 RepID=UPI00379C22B1
MNRTATRRSQILRTAAAALTAVAALALTACTEDGGGTKTEGKATSSASATDTQQTTGGSGGTGDGNTQRPAGGERTSGAQAPEAAENTPDIPEKSTQERSAPEKDKTENSTSGRNGKASEPSEADASIPDCSALSMNMAVQSVQRPINHLLLQATNESDAPCAIYGYPYLGFGEEAQSTVVPLESSKPQSVVVLKPGETAYAGIMTSLADGSGSEGYEADSVKVYLSNSQQDDSLDEETTLKLPQATHVDSSAWVSYWQSNVDDSIS